jgi:hypothetical protein
VTVNSPFSQCLVYARAVRLPGWNSKNYERRSEQRLRARCEIIERPSVYDTDRHLNHPRRRSPIKSDESHSERPLSCLQPFGCGGDVIATQSTSWWIASDDDDNEGSQLLARQHPGEGQRMHFLVYSSRDEGVRRFSSPPSPNGLRHDIVYVKT